MARRGTYGRLGRLALEQLNRLILRPAHFQEEGAYDRLGRPSDQSWFPGCRYRLSAESKRVG